MLINIKIKTIIKLFAIEKYCILYFCSIGFTYKFYIPTPEIKNKP